MFSDTGVATVWVGGAGSLVGNPGAGGVVNIMREKCRRGALAQLPLHTHECQEVTYVERGPLTISHKPEWLWGGWRSGGAGVTIKGGAWGSSLVHSMMSTHLPFHQ